MAAQESASRPHQPPLFGWRRVRYPFAVALLFGLLLAPGWKASYAVLFGRLLFIAAMGVLVFGLFERKPRRLPRWLARWVLQVLAVAIVMPIAAWVAYRLTTLGNPLPFWEDKDRLEGFATMSILGLLLAPWMAVSALVGQISGAAQKQALAFELERSKLERKAIDTRLRLLQAQVEPHFLFNTLANVRELVDSGSGQASTVLGSLIAYLRAAVPRLQKSTTTIHEELDLVRAYLEIMHMRIPDRLQYSLHADADAEPLDCPPMALLTLVENAVRHGIDPSEKGGRIDVRVETDGIRCRVRVVDTGAGLWQPAGAAGTGLATLRERLQLMFGEAARLELVRIAPHGVSAELDFPAARSDE
ncbi:sensor histidine kinase [Dokdonella immobilis]|uniref:Histidine kinase n=1 Tax=Dokdonella immobilis TaxID=578942 RepID=A0A1I4ZDS3_9GAMM|nr:histidine kinase [Dokdonella immobilis]SFN48424.1 Histidine kinase [Dokdonella immobilis]